MEDRLFLPNLTWGSYTHMTDNARSLTEVTLSLDRGAPSGGMDSTRRALRPLTVSDPLYGAIKVSAWAAALLATPPFQRLAGVSLSDVPGDLLFGHAFPSRLDHTIGVYHLARVARPRDRALQVAALAHDLGHGPFSHLSETLMSEWLGEDHETRSIRLLDAVRAALPESAQRRLDWLDWDEVASLMRGEGRGALLSGRLDYDNADNVARFLLHAGFGTPGYDPRVLARGLRYEASGDEQAQKTSASVSLQLAAEHEGIAWQSDRARVYRFLHEGDYGHRNLAAHAMLRKAVDLAAATHILPPDFFDLTDAGALALLGSALDRGLLALVRRVQSDATQWHRCIWEAEAPADERALPALLAHAEGRLATEAQLAAEAGLAPHEVICDALVSNALRALPPLATANRSGPLIAQPEPPTPPRVLHLFMAAGYGNDYARRLQRAAERRFAPLGVCPRATPI